MSRRPATFTKAEGKTSLYRHYNEEIAQYLGHSNPNTTYKVYARYSPDYLQNAAKALEIQ